MAALLGLGGLTQKVIGIFKKIHARVEKGLIALWTKLKTMGASLLKKVGIGKNKNEKKIDNKVIDLSTLKISVPTKTDGNHTLYVKKEKKGYSLIIESTPTFYSDFINQIETTQENKEEKDKALIIAKRLDSLIDSADDEQDKQEISEKLKELSKFTVSIIDLFNLKPLNPEKDYLDRRTHGINWQKNDAIRRAKDKKNPQGKWGSKRDLEYAGKIAATFKNNEMYDIPINFDNTSIVIYDDGSESKPDRIRIRKNRDNKTFHGFPIDSKTAGKIF